MTAFPVSPTQAAKPDPIQLRRGTKAYDFLFGMPLILWYGASLYFQMPTLLHSLAAAARPHANPVTVIDTLGRGAALLFAAVLIGLVVARRPASSGAQGFWPKAVAFFGAFLGVAILYLPRQKLAWELQLFSTVLILGGMAFSVYALIWLGRSISVLSEARKLVTGGPYSFVRHPLYLGEEAALVGLTLQYFSPLAIGILLMQFGFQLYRMQFEEKVMTAAFPEYGDYSRRVKRLMPGIY